eukprot:GHUV01020416.1.p1 GENE.GHUV01020416.1~~GHUV01020416.1.p1  ORF type:complete len:137 (+),score=10.47 GHUV01020416.1:990-1400(+)
MAYSEGCVRFYICFTTPHPDSTIKGCAVIDGAGKLHSRPAMAGTSTSINHSWTFACCGFLVSKKFQLIILSMLRSVCPSKVRGELSECHIIGTFSCSRWTAVVVLPPDVHAAGSLARASSACSADCPSRMSDVRVP